MEDIKRTKSEEFAVKIVFLCEELANRKLFIFSNQLERCGTSIGANIAESLYAESKDDLVHKLSIALKEAAETRFWLNVLFRSHKIDESIYQELLEDCEELIKILTSIRVNLKKKDIF